MRSSKPPDETNQTPPAVETPPAAPPAPLPPPPAVPPVAPPPVPPAAPLTAPPGPAKVELTSDQLKQRLDESRAAGGTAKEQELLKTLGYKTLAEAQAVLNAVKAKADAELSEIDRLKKENGELKPRADRAAKLEETFKHMVDQQFGELPENVRTAIDSIANGDPDERLRMMSVMRAAGVLNPAPAAPPPPAKPAPANTAGAGGNPKPAESKTKFETWDALKREGKDVAASIFYTANQADIEKSRPAEK
jgi:hypothetical protein